ncbi:MAG: cupin domain-containing protein [Prevotella sp.]|nr:cupin domain-containing protein [Prevotella sp.]
MIIDYQGIDEQVKAQFKGGDGEMLSRGMACDGMRLMLNRLTPGSSIGYHTHTDDMEVMYILSGNGHYDMDGVREDIKAGQAHYCPKGHSHAMYNDGEEDLVFFAIVK